MRIVPALIAGAYDDSGKRDLVSLSVRLEDLGWPLTAAPKVLTQGAGASANAVGDGQYHLHDLGVHELHNQTYVWFGISNGVSPESVEAIHLDRVLFVKE